MKSLPLGYLYQLSQRYYSQPIPLHMRKSTAYLLAYMGEVTDSQLT